MIVSFRSKALRRLYRSGDPKGLPADQVSRIENRLAVIDAASRVEDIDVPGFRLHRLTGNYAGSHAVWVTANWRLVFRFENGDAYDLDLVDYH